VTKSTKKTAAKAADDKSVTAKKKTATKKTAATKKTTAKPAVKKTVPKKKAAPKKTAASRKTPAKPGTATRKPTTGTRAAASTTAKLPAGVINAAQRHEMISEAAYLRAEAHGFGTDSHANWVHAENEIDARLARDGIIVKD
jgi:hypothetical protein